MNENISPNRPCPKCGAPLAAGTVDGLCPACLLALNLASQTDVTGETGPQTVKTDSPPPGEIAKYFPQLEIIECLGRGGMGVVYKARQPRLNRLIALKIIAPGREKDPAFAGRFEKEAQALARLSHPNIVTVHDFGETGGMYYLLMEYVDGVTLRQLLASGRISPHEALAIVPQICDALQCAHDLGIVHRDIKPENILMDRRGRVKVADFGLAKIIGNENEPATGATAAVSPSLTESGKVIGTPNYMAPEQASHPAGVDHRADIYALGVVFYQMLTGELPGKSLEPPSRKVLVDVRLDDVVLRALEKEPSRRYQQASVLKTQVETIAGSSSQSSGPAQKQSANTPLTYIAIFCAGLAGVLGWATFCWLPFKPAPPQLLVWSILAAALLGVLLGVRSRHTRVGKTAIVVGVINTIIWLLMTAFYPSPPDSAKAQGQNVSAPPTQSRATNTLPSPVAGRLAKEHNPEVLRIQLSQAEADAARQKRLFDAGLAPVTDLDAAQEKVDVLKAKLDGDDVLIAQVRLAAAQRALGHVSQLAKTGLVPVSEAGAAQAEVQVREAELKAAQFRKGGLTSPGKAEPKVSARHPASALQFRLIAEDFANNDGVEILTMQAREGNRIPLRVLPEVLLDDSAVALAGIDFDASGNRQIQVRFTEGGARQFAQITATNIHRQLAIVFHGRIISAPRIQDTISGGQCTISSGSLNAEECHEIVDALNDASKPSGEMWEFAPPQERSILFLNPTNGSQGWLDLDSGLLITNRSTDWKDRAGHDWIQTNGLDLTATRTAIAHTVAWKDQTNRVEMDIPGPEALFSGLDLVVEAAPPNSWESLTPADVVQNWKLLNRLPQQHPAFSAEMQKSDTFFFRTREGGKGILQILSNTTDNGAAQIRYKLVRK